MSTLEEVSARDVSLPAPARPSSLWRSRDYLLLWAGQAVSSIGTQMSQLAFPLLMLALTRSPVQAGILAALRGIPYTLLLLPAGALIDRWERKRTMALCDAGRALALGSVPVALALGHLTIIQLYAVTFVEGTLFTFFQTAETACLPRVVAPEQLTAAVAQNWATDSASQVVGPALGGVLYALARAVPFLVDAVSYAGSVVSLFFIRARFQEERVVTARPSLRAEIGEGLAWLWRHPVIRFLALLTAGLCGTCEGYLLIVIVMAQRLHAPTAAVGLILAAGGIGSLLGAAAVPLLRRRFRVGRILIVATWVWALSWPPYALAPNVVVLGLANTIGFVVVPIYMTVQYSYRLAAVPDQLQGRVNSVFRLIAYGCQPLSLVVTGALLQWIGPVPTVLLLFVPQIILAAVATLNAQLRAV